MNFNELTPEEKEILRQADLIRASSDLFGTFSKMTKPKISAWRNSTLDEDVSALMDKWRYKPEEVLVGHMYDSLKIFKHNMKEFDNYHSVQLSKQDI